MEEAGAVQREGNLRGWGDYSVEGEENKVGGLISMPARVFLPLPKQRVIVDALIKHVVLSLDDLSILLSCQPENTRSSGVHRLDWA